MSDPCPTCPRVAADLLRMADLANAACEESRKAARLAQEASAMGQEAMRRVEQAESRAAALEAALKEAQSELERERVRLAGCGVAALSQQADDLKPGDYGHSASLEDVLRTRKRLECTEALLSATSALCEQRGEALKPFAAFLNEPVECECGLCREDARVGDPAHGDDYEIERPDGLLKVVRLRAARAALSASPTAALGAALIGLVEAASDVVATKRALLEGRSWEDYAAYQQKYETTGAAAANTRATATLDDALKAYRAAVPPAPREQSSATSGGEGSEEVRRA